MSNPLEQQASDPLVVEAAELRQATCEAIIETATAKAILHRTTQDVGTTAEQVTRAALQYRKLERNIHEAVTHEVDFHYVNTLHALKEPH